MCVFCLLFGSGLSMIVGRTAPPTANVVVCGATDPNGGCAQVLIDIGHIPAGEPIATPWYPADMSPFGAGMTGSTEQGLPGVLAAINDFHRRGFSVKVHGYSQGSDLALAAANEVHVEAIALYGSPFPANGFFHASYIKNIAVATLLKNFGKLSTDRKIPSDTHVEAFYNEGDVYANYVPDQYDPIQIINKLNDTLSLDGHWLQPAGSAKCVFTDEFGVVNYVTPDENPFTHNGCAPSPAS